MKLNWKEVGIWAVIGFVAGMIILNVGGCSAKYWTGAESPGVKLHKNVFGASAEMTSDGSAHIGDLSYNPETGAFDLTDFSLDQKPSDVVKEEPAKILAVAQAQRVQVELAEANWKGITATVHELVPVFQLLAMAKLTPTSTGFNMTLPSGVGLGAYKNKSPQEMQEVFQAALTQLQSLNKALTTQPTTQPAQ